jgi:CRISPR-associated protein Cas1
MVKGSKTVKITLDKQGSYLGMEKGCYIVKDREGNIQRYPQFENQIGEVILKSGSCVSTGALASLGFWNINVLITTQRGKPCAVLRDIDDDSHVWIRILQYKALESKKGLEIAQTVILKKIEGQQQILKKYNLRPFDYALIEKIRNVNESSITKGDFISPYTYLGKIRYRLNNYEGHLSEHYFNQIFSVMPERLQPEHRRTFKAYDAVNNLFNLGYTMLKWKVYKALVNAKLEPYLGFLHSEQFGKPSLVCDFMEIYRYIIDDFVIGFCKDLSKKDFIVKSEVMSRGKIGKREYLNDNETKEFMVALDKLFNSYVDIPRIRHGNRQELDTLISEEALLFAKCLRHKNERWIPRLPII